jgi:hypothetical protein
MRRVSSRVKSFDCRATPRLVLEINIRDLLIVVAHDKASGLFLDGPGRREAAFSHGNGSRVRELTFREEHLARRGGAKMKMWPIAVASLIFGWAILQDRRHSVRELYRAHDGRRRH